MNLIKGWANIAAFFGREERGFRSKARMADLVSAGAVFYQWENRGTKRVKVVCAWDTELARWAGSKTLNGEVI